MKKYTIGIILLLLIAGFGYNYLLKDDFGGKEVLVINDTVRGVEQIKQDIQEITSLQKVSVESFAKAMEDKDAILIDIRTPEELKETGVLSSNVINIDFYSEDYENTLQALDKNATYLIYCRSGNRSGQTLEIMKRLGFKNVLDLEKGVISWKEAGKKLYTWKETSEEQSEKIRIITVEAQRFSFTPNEIRVKQGEKVALLINDIDTDHGAQFDEMEVFYEQNGNIILDTSIPGTYEFACATMCGDGHRQMKGVVVVE